MSDYRTPPPPRADAVFWYGPFPKRAWPIFVLLAMMVLVALLWVDAERSVLRQLTCDRPGECVVLRGSDLFGAHEDRRFDTRALDTLEKRHTGGKSPHYSLVVLLGTGSDTPYELTGGSGTDELFERVRPFVDDRLQKKLLVEWDVSPGDRTFSALVGLALAAATTWLVVARLRSAVRVRIEVERARGVVIVAHRGPLRRTIAREVPIDDVLYVEVEKQVGARDVRRRVVIVTREGLDVALSEGFVPGAIEHEAIASDLMAELSLPKEEDLPRR